MKKRILSLVIMLSVVVLGASVSTVDAKIRFGIKAGVDVVDHKINGDLLSTENRLGFQVGPSLEFGLPIVGGLEMSLLYGHKEYKTEFKEADATLSDYNYLTLPLNLKKRWDLGLAGIYIYGGPYATMKLSGGDFKFKEFEEDIEAKNFGVGLNFGAGVSLFSHVDIGLQYRVDLTDRYSTDSPNLENFSDKKYQSWSVGLTYYF